MKIIFLGVGEAFDENIPNNSHLVITERTKLLLDCGITAAAQVWKFNPDPNLLDAIYISHWHADHYFGLPGLLLRMWEGGRTMPITIISRKGFKEQFKKLMDLAYLGFQEKFKFEINILEAEVGKETKFNDLSLSFTKTVHSSENLAVKISDNKNTIKCLALTHINRDFRKNDLPKIREKIKSDKVKIIIPEPLQEYDL